MYKELLERLNPLNFYYHLRHIQIITSCDVFRKDRTFLYNIFKKDYNVYKRWIEPSAPSALAIDVVVPVIEKDLKVLPYVIEGIRKHVKHPIKNIYIVAPNKEVIVNAAKREGAVFIDEVGVCSISKEQINFVVNGNNRSGWIYQQLLKLNLNKIGTERFALVVDADTVFIQDTVFEKNGKLYFDFSDEFTKPYYTAFEMLTGMQHKSQVSFVSHYMLFDKQRLEELKQHIKNVGNGKEAEHIIIDLKEKIIDNSYFSEYETYANYCISKHANDYRLRYWFNKSLNSKEPGTFEEIISKNRSVHKSVSLHAYNS